MLPTPSNPLQTEFHHPGAGGPSKERTGGTGARTHELTNEPLSSQFSPWTPCAHLEREKKNFTSRVSLLLDISYAIGGMGMVGAHEDSREVD